MSDSTYSSRNIKASLRAFAFGKALTAPGSMLLIFLYAAFMPRDQYAAYVAATAVLELCIDLGTFGLDWLTQTIVPSVRVNGTGGQLRRAVRRLVKLQSIPYLLIGSAIGLLAGPLSGLMSGVVSSDVLRVYGVVIMLEGMARMLRDQLLSALMMQRVVQLLQVTRLLMMLGTLCVLHFGGFGVTAWQIAWLELSASAMTVLIGGVALSRYLAQVKDTAGETVDLSAWFGRKSLRFAINTYSSFILSICLGGYLATGLVARYLGADATAQFGFAARLVEQVRRFLPLDLVWSVIRPALIGRFEREGRNFAVLVNDVGLILRANLLLLGGAVAVFVGAGSELALALTHGNMHLPHYLLAAMLIQVLGHSVRRSLELMTYLIGRSHLFLIGSFASLLVPLITASFLPVFESLYVVAAAMAAAEMLWSAIVYAGLARDGKPLSISIATWLKLAAIVVVAGLATAFCVQAFPGVPGLVASIALGGAIYLIGVLVGGIVSRPDIDAIRRLLRSRSSAATASA